MISKWHLQDENKQGRPKGTFKLSAISCTKRCCRCKKTKMIHHFSSDKSRNDGLEVRCSSCTTSKVKQSLRLKGIKSRALVKYIESDF
jgi:superfamily II helicase